MRITIGTIFAGRVEAFGEEFIRTKFFVLGSPLLPLESYYCVQKIHGGSFQGFEISLHWKSILFAYMRWWLLAFSLYFIFTILAQEQVLWGLLAASLLGLAFLTLWLGRLAPTEKRRRLVLWTITGLGAHPRVLPPGRLINTRGALEDKWKELTADTPAADWRNALSTHLDVTLLPLLFCRALYLGEKELSERAWQAIEQEWDTLFSQG